MKRIPEKIMFTWSPFELVYLTVKAPIILPILKNINRMPIQKGVKLKLLAYAGKTYNITPKREP